MEALDLMRSGARNTLTPSAISRGWAKAGSRRRCARESEISSRPNSPPCARIVAVRKAVSIGAPEARTITATTTSFSPTIASSQPRIGHGSSKSLAQVDLRADTDEEDADQEVAERANLLLDDVARVAFADEHAGEEGTDRRREAGDVGDRSGAESEEEPGQLEEIAVGMQGQPGRKRAHDGTHQQQRDGEDADPEAYPEQRLGRRGPLGGDAEQDQEECGREVLEQQHCHGDPSMRRVELVLLGELLEAKRRRRHRHGTAEDDRLARREAEDDPGPERDGRGDGDHLGQAQPEDRPPELNKLRQRELEPEHEEQEYDPELGELRDPFAVGEGSGSRRAEDQAGSEIAENARQAQPRANGHREKGAADQDKGDLEDGRRGVMHFQAPCRSQAEPWLGAARVADPSLAFADGETIGTRYLVARQR